MSSYLRSWLPTLSLRQSRPATATEEEEEEEEESPTTPTNPSFSFQKPDDGDDDDAPPAFPAIASAQRISSRAPASTLMPPPSIPASRRRIPGPPAPSSSSSLMPPPSTTRPPTQLSKSKKRAKVVLAPGHSPLDWAALKSSGTDLRVTSFFVFYLHCLTYLRMFRVVRRPWHAYPRRYCACTINVMMRGRRSMVRSTISRLT